jgi:hypothetical protein
MNAIASKGKRKTGGQAAINAHAVRAVASMSAVQLITAILEAGPQLEALGLQIRLTNGLAQIFTSKIQMSALRRSSPRGRG